jgi:hypothetical protein
MGGQACIFYGAAEFSRDLDLLILADATNLPRLVRALDGLDAEVIAVFPLAEKHLLRGHAVHLRCRREDVAGLRIDLMSSLRGVAGFDELLVRRTTIEVAGEPIDLLAMENLVCAKKTQLDKDLPVIRRLVEQSYLAALSAHLDDVSETLEAEEREERRKDREYWAPLKRELDEFRLGRRTQ